MKHAVAAFWLVPIALGIAASGCGQSVDQRLSKVALALESSDSEVASFEAKAVLQQVPDSGKARMLLAKALMQLGDLPGAEVELQRAMALGDAEGEARVVQADVWMLQNRPGQVIAEYENLTTQNRNPGPAYLLRVVRSHLSLGQLDEARQQLAEALKSNPTDLGLRILAIRIEAAEGRTDDAMKQSDAVLAAEPKNAQAWLLRGDLQQLMRAPSESAQASYRRALDAQPDLIAAHTALVALMLHAEDLEGAKQQVESLRKLRPNNAQTRYLEALVALSSGQLDRARELTQQLIRTAPKNPKILLLAGQAETRLGSQQLANTYLSQAVGLDPDSSAPRRALAEFLLNRGQPQRALETLKPLTKPGTKDGHALVLQAQAHLQLGDARAADVAFGTAAKIIPDDPNLRTIRAQARVERNADFAALTDLSRAARNDRSPRGELALIAAHMSKGDLRQSKAAVAALAAKLPKSPLPNLLLGRLAEQEKDATAAERHFVAALAMDPRYIEALEALVGLDIRLGRMDAAVSRVRGHLEQHPGLTEAHLLLADLFQKQGKATESSEQLAVAVKADPSNPATHLAIIRRLTRLGDARGAMEAARVAVAALPDNLDLAERLGAAQLQSGEPMQAIATLTKLVGKRDAVSAWLLLAQAHDMSGSASKAEEAVRRAMKLSPEAPAVLHAATLLAVKQRQFDRALSYCRKAQLADSAEALGYRLEGDVFSAQLLWQQAIASYRTALTKQNIGTVPSALHNALMRAGKQADAAAFAATWLRQHPDDASFRLRLANLAMERNDLETAETGLRRVVTQQPDSVEALNNLAHVLVLQNKKGAVKMAQAAFNLAPNRADVVDTLAQAQATEGQLDDAIETQLLAKKLAPQSPLMHFNLVRLYLKAGQTSKAREALESASSEPWSSQRAKDIEALRQQLKG